MSQKRAGSSKSYDSLIHPGDTPSNQGAAAFAHLAFCATCATSCTADVFGWHDHEGERVSRGLTDADFNLPPTTELRFNQPIARPVGAEVYSAVFALSYGQQRGASVDILYDLFETLRPELIEAGFTRHVASLRRRGLLPKNLEAYFDSTLIGKSPNSSFEKAAWIKMRGKSYYGFKLFLLIDIATKTLLYVRFTTVDQSDSRTDPSCTGSSSPGIPAEAVGHGPRLLVGRQLQITSTQKDQVLHGPEELSERTS